MSLSMPPEFLGEMKTQSIYTKSVPREWTVAEVEWMTSCLDAGYSVEDVATASGRTKISVSTKVKRMSKVADSYNKKHRELKYLANGMFVSTIEPASVLDVFAANSYYLDTDIKKVVTNDKDTRFATDYHLDAFTLMCQMVVENKKFDVVDLDPYGSAYDCLPMALRIARKGLVISFGEWGHKRWKRFDYVRPRYGIDSIEAFTSEAFFAELNRLASIEKKKITVLDAIQYGNFLRVYCSLERLIITEQWEASDD
jgi:hypothetical protein